MAKQVINVGTADFAGDGDGLRTAFTKVNDNFTELYDDDAQDITLASFSATQTAASGGGALVYSNTTGVFTYTPPDLNSTTEISSDLTPQLGGDLDTNGKKIVSSGANQDITIEPNGNGDILLKTGGQVGIGEVGSPDTDLHIKTPNAVITLQRTADANKPGIDFQNSNGNVRAELRMDGTTGTSNEIYIRTWDGATTAERFRVGHTGVTIAGTLNGHTVPAGSGTIALTSDITSLADTDALPEGSTNLYYTDARADARAQLKVDALVDSAPGTMDTLNELAAALGDDPNFATTVTNSIAEKLPLAGGTLAGDLNVGGNSIVGGSSPINIAPGGTAKIVLSGETQLGGDVDGQSYNITTTGKILYANMYAQLADLPSATTYHGMFAHVHATGAGYFAHGGNWIQLANYTDLSPYLPTANLNTNIDLHLNQAGAGNNQVLSWDGADYAWVNQSGGGGGGMSDLIDDTTPQLGGTLDLNSNSMTSAGNISIQTVSTANAIDIGTSSYTGSAVNIGSQALSTPVNISGESNFGAHATFDRGVHERFYTLTGATGTVTHNCWWGHLWYHTGVAADFTANITNLGLEQEDATNVAIVINQGNTAYIPNAIEIAGVAQTIIWQGNSAPTGTANGTDTFSFTILNDGGTYVVLGQMTAFGGV